MSLRDSFDSMIRRTCDSSSFPSQKISHLLSFSLVSLLKRALNVVLDQRSSFHPMSVPRSHVFYPRDLRLSALTRIRD